MATPVEEIKLKLLLEGKEFNAVLKLSDESIQKIYDDIKNVPKMNAPDASEHVSRWGMISTGIQNATQTVRDFMGQMKELVGESVNNAADLEVLRSNFQGTTEDLELFRKATSGTVSEANLIKLSNQATSLGLTLQQQAIFFSLAEDAADKFGGTVESGMEGIIRASEGSIKAVSALGIQKKEYEERTNELAKAEGDSLEKLDAETQKRIRLQAIIELSGLTLDDVAKKTKDEKDLIESMNVAFEEGELKLGNFILKGLVPLLKEFDKTDDGIKKFITTTYAIGEVVISALPMIAQLVSAKQLLGIRSAIAATQVAASTTAIEAQTAAAASGAIVNRAFSFSMLGWVGAAAAVGFGIFELTRMINDNAKAIKANREEADKMFSDWDKSGFGPKNQFEKGKPQTPEGKVNLGGFLSRHVSTESTKQATEETAKQTKKVFELREEIRLLKEAREKLDQTQLDASKKINKEIEAKEKLISKITGEKDSNNQLSDAIREQNKLREEAERLEERKSDIVKGFQQKDEIESFRTKIETEVSPALKPSSTDSSDVIKQRLLDANKSVNQQILEEEKKFNDLLSNLPQEKNEKKVDEINRDLEISKTKIGILKNTNEQLLDSQKDFNEKTIEEEQKLAELKEQFFLDEKQRGEEEAFNEFVEAATDQQMKSMLITEEENYQRIKSEMKALEYQGDADAVQKEWDLLQKESEISNQKKNILKTEQIAIQEKVKQGILASTQEYDAKQSLGVQLNKLANETIRRIIAEAVATQVAKVIATLPFPINAVLAPLAGLAIQAAIEKIIPKFESGAVDINGKRHTNGGELVEIEGGESVINRYGTSQNKKLLQMINDGEKFDVVDNKAISNKIFSKVPAATAVNNYLSANLMNGFDSLSRTFVKTIDKQTERLEAVERNVNLSLVEFDQKYKDYLDSQSYMNGG